MGRTVAKSRQWGTRGHCEGRRGCPFIATEGERGVEAMPFPQEEGGNVLGRGGKGPGGATPNANSASRWVEGRRVGFIVFCVIPH